MLHSLQNFSHHSLILTSNKRLALTIQNDITQSHLNNQEKIWESPKVIPLNAWIVELYNQFSECDYYILSNFEERLLWHRIINDDNENLFQNYIGETSKNIQSAYHTIEKWNIDIKDLTTINQDNVTYLLHHINKFKKKTASEKFLILPNIIRWLITEVHYNRIILPEKIFFAGFDTLSPLETQLKTLLSEHTQVETLDTPVFSTQPVRIPFQSTDDEIRYMAHWASTQALQGKKNIGCIIPQLHQIRGMVYDLFQKVTILQHDSTKNIFNISVGNPLSQHPLIEQALMWAKLPSHQIPIDSLIYLLTSPYMHQNTQDQAFSAQLEHALRQLQQHDIEPAWVTELLHTFEPTEPQQSWLMRWTSFWDLHSQLQQKTLPASQWIGHLQTLWETIELAKGHPLSSEEYQIHQRWLKILLEFKRLDHLLPHLDFHSLTQLLKFQAEETLFQPQSTARAPIQIMGFLESANHTFDALWIMGLSHDLWPPKPAPNPYLPYQLQAELAMPRASAKQEKLYAERLQARLFQSAQTVIISYPTQDHEIPLNVSPLINDLPIATLESLHLPPIQTPETLCFATRSVEAIADHQGPALSSQETLRQSSALFEYHALCPFRSFAQVRLKAEKPLEPQLGYPATLQGKWVHRALEHLWKHLQHQNNLKALSIIDRQTAIRSAIDVALEALPHHAIVFLESIERRRLQKLLNDWLTQELERPEFEVIACESTQTITVGPLQLRVRIDRVDRIEGQYLILIDYKTNTYHRTDHWIETPLKSPQLPLYATFAYPNSSGIAIAEVKAGSHQWKGLLDQGETFSKLNTCEDEFNWQTLTTYWKETLTELSHTFAQGAASVAPADHTACSFCDLKPLCRIGSHS